MHMLKKYGINKGWGCLSWQRLRRGTLAVSRPPGLSYGGRQLTESGASQDHTRGSLGLKQGEPQTLVGNVRGRSNHDFGGRKGLDVSETLLISWS